MSKAEKLLLDLQYGCYGKKIVIHASKLAADYIISDTWKLLVDTGLEPEEWKALNNGNVVLLKDAPEAVKKAAFECIETYRSLKPDEMVESSINEPIDNPKAGGFVDLPKTPIKQIQPTTELVDDALHEIEDARVIETGKLPERNSDEAKARKFLEQKRKQNEEKLEALERREIERLEALERGEIEKPVQKNIKPAQSERSYPEKKKVSVTKSLTVPNNMRNKQVADLTIEDITNFICPEATVPEAMMFLRLCQARGINPFLKEAYLIKFKGNQPASMVVSRDYFARKAEEHPQYDGCEDGIILKKENGEFERREGTFLLQEEKLVGGWCKVYRKDRSKPTLAEVALHEYQQRNSEGTLNKFWNEKTGKPATMIDKVAQSQSFKKAFPGDLSGMYDASEIGDEGVVDAVYEVE